MFSRHPGPFNEHVDAEWSGVTAVKAAVILRRPLGHVVFPPNRNPEASYRVDPEMGRAGRLGLGGTEGYRPE